MNMTTTETGEMRIIKVSGSDKLLYSLIGSTITHPLVISLNGGYPFKNTEHHVWYIALREDKNVAGFLSVLKNTICNDCTLNDRKLLAVLIEKAISDMPKGVIARFVAHKDELSLMEELGFELTKVKKPGVKYFRMFKKL
jgi:hypothetical protein